jgi:hypothetical protein
MQAQVEQQVSFARGMQDSAAPTEFQQDEVELLLNGRVSFIGNSIDRRKGSAKTHASALNSGAQCYGATEFFTAAGAQQLCAFIGDKFYFSANEGLTWTNPSGATSLSTAYWDTAQMRVGVANLLICTNGSTNIYKWDGTTWGTLSNEPANAKFCAVFNDRLYVAGHSGVTVAASSPGNPDLWASPDGYTVEVTTHDGEQELTGLYQMATVLLAFKRESTSYLEGFGFATLEVEAGGRGLSRSTGCLAFRSIAQVGEQGVCWLSERGFEFYQLGGQIQLVSRPIQSFLDTIAWTNIKNGQGIPSAMYWPQKNEYWCGLPAASSQNDYVFRWRPPTATTPACVMLDKHSTTTSATVFIGSDGDLQVASDTSRDQVRVVNGSLVTAKTGLYTEVDGTTGHLELATVAHDHAALFAADRDDEEQISAPWGAGYDGFIRKLEILNSDNASTTTADDGVAVQLRILSRPLLFGSQTRRKRLRTLRVASSQGAESTLSVTPVADGSDGTTKTLTMPVSAGDRPRAKKSRTSLKGYSLQLNITSSDDVSVGSMEAIAEPLREGF